MRKLVILALLAVMIFSGCSSSNLDTTVLPEISEGNALLNLGDKAYDRLDLEAALNFYNEAFLQFSRVDYIPGKVASSLAASGTANEMGDYSQADKLLNRAASYNTKQYDELVALTEIENTYERGEDSKTVKMVDEVIGQFATIENRAQARCYSMLSNAETGNPSDHQFESLKKLITTDDLSVSTKAFINFSLGKREFKLKNFLSAENYFAATLHYDKKTGKQRNIVENLTWLGKTYFMSHRRKQALVYFNRAKETFTALSAHEKIAEIDNYIDTK